MTTLGRKFELRIQVFDPFYTAEQKKWGWQVFWTPFIRFKKRKISYFSIIVILWVIGGVGTRYRIFFHHAIALSLSFRLSHSSPMNWFFWGREGVFGSGHMSDILKDLKGFDVIKSCKLTVTRGFQIIWFVQFSMFNIHKKLMAQLALLLVRQTFKYVTRDGSNFYSLW